MDQMFGKCLPENAQEIKVVCHGIVHAAEQYESEIDYLKKQVVGLKQENERLNKREARLCALENHGVDNWSGYGEALRDLYKDEG